MKSYENTETIREYSSVILNDLNTSKDISYLKKKCFGYEKSKPYKIRELRDEKVEIENTSYSGIIQLDKKRLHFSTKVATNLFYMLSFLKDEECFYYDPDKIIDIKKGRNFFDILGRLFLNEFLEIYKRGFYKKYVKKEENIPFLKGKFLIKGQIKNEINKKTKFYCSYDDLTYDCLENKIMLRAATLLIPLIRFNEKVKRDLIYYSNLMRNEISLVNVQPNECDTIQYNRLNDYYEKIIQFSKVILKNYFIRTTYVGISKGFSFIVNMNKVYEDFITELIKELVDEEDEFNDFIVDSQERFDNLVREKKIITKPDIILRKKISNEHPIIIDAKYKRQESNTDYYQVIAYALAIPTVKACFLIYPSGEKTESEPLTLDPGIFGNARDEVKLHAVKVDLKLKEEANFKDYIRDIKEQLKRKLRFQNYVN